MAKTEDKKQSTKDILIETALRMFNEKGFDHVGVRDIAAAANVTTGSFYHHFKSKDDVLHEIYKERDLRFGEQLESMARKGPYCNRILEFFIQDMTDTVEADGVDFTAHRMFNMKVRSRESNALYKGMTMLIEKAKENGEFLEKYETPLINRYLFMVFRGILYDWCIDSSEGESKALREMMQQGMSAAIRAFQSRQTDY